MYLSELLLDFIDVEMPVNIFTFHLTWELLQNLFVVFGLFDLELGFYFEDELFYFVHFGEQFLASLEALVVGVLVVEVVAVEVHALKCPQLVEDFPTDFSGQNTLAVLDLLGVKVPHYSIYL